MTTTTTVIISIIIITPHRSTSEIRPIATDGVAWSVSLSVGHATVKL